MKYFGKDARFIQNACNCWNDNNEPELSIRYIDAFTQESQAELPLMLCYADALIRSNRLQESNSILLKCVDKEQGNKDIWIRIGLTNVKRGRLEEALKAFENANKIDSCDLDIIANRITILTDIGDFEKAESLIMELSENQQSQVVIAQAKAGLMMSQKKLVEATQLYQYICRLNPVNANYWLNWAAALRGLRWTVAPHRILKCALCFEPTNEDVQEALLQILAEMGKTDEAQRCMKLWPKSDNNIKDTYLFNRQFLGIGTSGYDSRYLSEQAQTWEKKCQTRQQGNLWLDTIKDDPKHRKLKIGYLSADFANHPVGRFLLPILINHDRETVEIWALSCGSHDDWITEKIRKDVDHWIDLRFRSTSECTRMIADLGLDIIIELGGFSAESRLEILCHRPAPIQLSYLGYPGPTYLKCIDGWIGDKVLFEQLDQIDREAHPLIEINGGYMVFDTGGELPMPKRTAGSQFRFGSFNHARKLTDSTIDLFCKVMEANPDAELVLKSISFCEPDEKERIKQRFENAGLASERLLLLDWVEGGLNHLQLYSEIDVALDPIPYGGATTTAEALWMGVPVVALAGNGMVGRLSATLLIHGKQEQWLARDKNQYIEIASKLALKGPRKEDIRYKLRVALQKSQLAYGKRLSRELERKYIALSQTIKSP